MVLYERYLASEVETEAFGDALARATQSSAPPRAATIGGRIYLEGDLGAGKTTLARGVLRGYGYQGAVKSPTYTLVEPYEEANFKLYHFDLYRLADPEEVEFLGVFDYFDEGNLCLIEWAERGKGFLPPADIEITLSVERGGRHVQWKACSALGQQIAHRLSEYTESQASGTDTR